MKRGLSATADLFHPYFQHVVVLFLPRFVFVWGRVFHVAFVMPILSIKPCWMPPTYVLTVMRQNLAVIPVSTATGSLGRIPTLYAVCRRPPFVHIASNRVSLGD